MNHFTEAGFSLRIREDSDLKAASDAAILMQVVDELTSTEERFYFLIELHGVPTIASPTAVLDFHQVIGFWVSVYVVRRRL